VCLHSVANLLLHMFLQLVCPANIFAGYQVELFRMLAQEVGWEDTDYVFSCIKYSDMLEDLKSPNGSCSMSAAGASINSSSISNI
jgi:hypothetical protein